MFVGSVGGGPGQLAAPAAAVVNAAQLQSRCAGAPAATGPLASPIAAARHLALRCRGRATPGCPQDKMGPTRGVEDTAADILGLARSLVHETDATLGRSKSTLRKTMRKTQTQRAATTSPTSKLRTTRWKSRTMQQLANGRTPELDFGPTKDELSNFDNDGQLMSIKDHCAVPPPEPRAPVIEPPTDVEALRRDYDAVLRGHAMGLLVRRGWRSSWRPPAASERAVAAYKAEKRAAHRSATDRAARTTCAALLASSGRVHVACAVRSNTDAAYV